jgi:hypothetical protein
MSKGRTMAEVARAAGAESRRHIRPEPHVGQPPAERPNILECLQALVRALARSDALRDHQQLNRVDEHA